MKKTMISSMAAILLLALVPASFTACSDVSDAKDSSVSVTGAVTEQSTAPETDSIVKDSLPEMDYQGQDVNILIREEVAFEFDTEQSGDLMDDAVFQRNSTIAERFHLNLNYIKKPGLWQTADSYKGLITNTVLAGDDTYDIVTGQSNIVLPLAVNDIYLDLSDAENIDFTKPYWKSGYHENVAINGHLYSVSGDYALTTLTQTNALFFNTKMFDDRGIPYPYQLVRDGKWTLDQFLTIVHNFCEDLDGDGDYDMEDLWGFSAYNNSINPFTYSCDAAILSKTKDGKHVIDFPSETDIAVYDKIYDLVHSDYYRPYDSSESGVKIESAIASDLAAGKAAMAGIVLEGVEYLRDMSTDFGILPYPKQSEEQEEYISSILRRFTVASIPITAKDPAMSGLVLEALSCEGYNSIIPTYFNIALKEKYSRDTDTKEMLDIIRSTAYFDFSDAFYGNLIQFAFSDYLAGYAYGDKRGLASDFASVEKRIQKALDQLYEDYSD